MSRIGRMPIPKPKGVEVTIEATRVAVKGPKGSLERPVSHMVTVEDQGDHLTIDRVAETRHHRSTHGLTRTLINNMMVGVSEGFKKELRLVGTGYRAAVQGKALQLTVGYSHPVSFVIPDGITVEVGAPEQVREGSTGTQHLPIIVSGIDKELVGETAASIRRVKKPEAYEPSKGIRYVTGDKRVRLLPKKARA